MKTSDAVLYIQQNARFSVDAPNTPYSVRFPSPTSSTIFFSDDTRDLVDQVLAFSKTSEGRRAMKFKNFKWYINSHQEALDDAENNDEGEE